MIHGFSDNLGKLTPMLDTTLIREIKGTVYILGEELMTKEYDNDLSRCKVGDWIFTIHVGWARISDIDDDRLPIVVRGRYYTYDGLNNPNEKCPSAFVTPPKCFNPGPKPVEFKKGDRVLVGSLKEKRYFSHMFNDMFVCFEYGCDEWTSNGTTAWSCCIKWEGMDE